MKKLFIILLLFVGCVQQKDAKQPLFLKGEEVTFDVPQFYSLVCSGNGYVVGAEWNPLSGDKYIYNIQTPEINCGIMKVVESSVHKKHETH